ncbi:MAG TPA: DUF3459 domain-containing protein, partial [Candidatus Limnocylindrales bacterium]|nr:DUF3459 domain-containing protein [Candidatus Limnocylindrales bacterium]
DLEWVSAPGDDCLVLRRPASDADPHVLVAMNLGDSPALVAAREVLASSGGALEPGKDGFWLPVDTAAWLR